MIQGGVLATALVLFVGIAMVPVGLLASDESVQLKEWTVMVYCAADNDLAPFAASDINEMEMVGSTDQLDIIVQYDGSAKHSPETPGSVRLHIVKDVNPEAIASETVENLGEVDMGSKQTFREFLEWGVTGFPAKKYMVVLWNHGSGWYQDVASSPLDYTSPKDVQDVVAAIEQLQGGVDRDFFEDFKQSIARRRMQGLLERGTSLRPFRGAKRRPVFKSGKAIAIDEGGDSPTALSTTDLADAFAAARQSLPAGSCFEVIGFDACLMGMVEVFYALREQGRFSIGSEKTEPGDGWAYDKWLAPMAANPQMDGAAVGQVVISSYIEHYGKHNDNVENPFHRVNATLATVDLSKMKVLVKAIEALARELVSHPELRSDYWKVVINTQHCGEIGAVQPNLLLIMTAHRDLIDLMLKLRAAVNKPAIQRKAQAVIVAARKAMTSFSRLEGTPLMSVKNTTGFSIYLPFLRLEPTYADLEMGQGAWAAFLKLFKATQEEAQVLIDQMQGKQEEETRDRFERIYRN